MSDAVAAIDCGSNTVRLLAVDPEHRVLARGLRVTRLGEGVDTRGELLDAAIGRTVEAISAYVEQARAVGADTIRIVATSAVRDAENRDRFLDATERACGVRPDVLTGDVEAQLSYRGATSDQPRDLAIAVVDIGGGSTEMILGRDHVAERCVSTQIGCVRHTERFDAHGVVGAERLAGIDAELRPALAAAVAGWPQAERLVGVAGTVTTLAAIDKGLTAWNPDASHGHRFSVQRVVAMRDDLARMTPTQRLEAYPVMERGREDVIVVGASILLAAAAAFGVDEIVNSELEILHGVVSELLARRNP